MDKRGEEMKAPKKPSTSFNHKRQPRADSLSQLQTELVPALPLTQPLPNTQPQPQPQPELQPLSQPERQPLPQQEPQPLPQQEPQPLPQQEPQPLPQQEPQPLPQPHPQPQLQTPAQKPTPTPKTTMMPSWLMHLSIAQFICIEHALVLQYLGSYWMTFTAAAALGYCLPVFNLLSGVCAIAAERHRVRRMIRASIITGLLAAFFSLVQGFICFILFFINDTDIVPQPALYKQGRDCILALLILTALAEFLVALWSAKDSAVIAGLIKPWNSIGSHVPDVQDQDSTGTETEPDACRNVQAVPSDSTELQPWRSYNTTWSFWLGATMIAGAEQSMFFQSVWYSQFLKELISDNTATNYLIYIGCGLWCTVFYLLAAGFAIATSFQKTTCKIYATLFTSLVAALAGLAQGGIVIAGWIEAFKSPDAYMSIFVILLIAALVEVVAGVWLAILCCYGQPNARYATSQHRVPSD